MTDDERFVGEEPASEESQVEAGAPGEAGPGTPEPEPPREAAAGTPPAIVLSPPSIFQDRDLTPVEAKRQALSPSQPKPWEPTPDDLDPNSDQGWERAANHELIAVRPEDVVVPPPFAPAPPEGATQPAAGALPPAGAAAAQAAAQVAAPQPDPHHALPIADPSAVQRYLAPATSALAWAKGGSAGSGAQPAAGDPAAASPATAAAAASASAASPSPASPSAAFTPFGSATGSPLLTPLPSMTEPAPGAAATGPFAIPPEAAAVAVATGAVPRRRPWSGARGSIRRGARAAARPVMLLLLFVFGIVFGSTVYTRSQPAPVTPGQVAAQATTDPGVTAQVPPQIQSLIAALNSDDQSQVQLVVPAQPYRLLAGELAVDGIVRILGARAMSTYAVGPDSATEILVTGDDGQGNALTFNLVVHLHDGQITDFR